MDYIIASATHDAIKSIAELHRECFKGYFLTSLGNKFLEFYYATYLKNSEHTILVAKTNGRICGLVTGTISSEKLNRELFRKNFWAIAKILAVKFIMERHFRCEIFKRTKFIKQALQAKMRALAKEWKATSKNRNARLLSIAVLEEFRGKGISVDLIKKFEEEMKRKGVVSCGLSVKSGNLPAIGLYKKAGWKIEKQGETSISFTKRLQ